MTWFFLALVPPLGWSLTNLVDQYMVRRYFAENALGYMFFSALCNLPFIAALALCYPEVLEVPGLQALSVAGIGVLYIVMLVPYAMALQLKDASQSLPVFQTIPFFTLLIGVVFLGERMAVLDLVAGAMIIAAAMGMLWDFTSRAFAWKPFWMILWCSVGYGVYTTVLRQVALDWPWYQVSFWLLTGWSVIGVPCLFLHRASRTQFRLAWQSGGTRALALGLLQQSGDILATVFLIMALAAAPAATYVMLVNGLQPFYLLVLGIGLSFIAPGYFGRPETGRVLLFRLGCAGVIFAGLALLNL